MDEAETERSQTHTAKAPSTSTAGRRVVGFNITEDGVSVMGKVMTPSKAPPAAARMTPTSSMSSSSSQIMHTTPPSGLSQTRKETTGASGSSTRISQGMATPPKPGPSTPTKADLGPTLGPTFTPTRAPVSGRIPSSSRRTSYVVIVDESIYLC